MKFKAAIAISLSSLLASSFAFAQFGTAPDDGVVMGACIVTKFKNHNPPIPESKIAECGKYASDRQPACFGLTNTEYGSMVGDCMKMLENAKCVSAKIKVPLLNYVNCIFDANPKVCFIQLGSTPEAVQQYSADCLKEG